MRWWVWGLVACARAAPHEPLSNVTDGAVKLVAIENVAPLQLAKPDGAVRDCRPSTVVRKRFAGQSVLVCGSLDVKKDDERAKATARDCVTKALVNEQPFLLEVKQQGFDSDVASGLLAVNEYGKLTAFRFLYDSDPCGGTCPLQGSSRLDRCKRVVVDRSNLQACHYDVMQCFECEDLNVVDRCEFGR